VRRTWDLSDRGAKKERIKGKAEEFQLLRWKRRDKSYQQLSCISNVPEPATGEIDIERPSAETREELRGGWRRDLDWTGPLAGGRLFPEGRGAEGEAPRGELSPFTPHADDLSLSIAHGFFFFFFAGTRGSF